MNMNEFIFQPRLKFLDPEQLLFKSGLARGQIVADLGAGNGHYAMAAAKIVGNNGQVFVIDIMEDSLGMVSSEARLKGLRNVKTIRSDLELPNATGSLPAGQIDLVIYANVLHQVKNRERLFEDAFRLLATGGKVLVVEWNNKPGPIGPPSASRITEGEIMGLAKGSSLAFESKIETDKYHYGLIFKK